MSSVETLIPIFEKFGAIFVENEFDLCGTSQWDRMSPYIIKPDDIVSVLSSFRADPSYPANLNRTLQNHEASALAEHLSNYLRIVNKYLLVQSLTEIIMHLPIFIEVDHTSPISLLPGNKEWYLLPREEENSYGKIIYPRRKGGILSTHSQNLCYILEEIIQVPRLTVYSYWRNCVIPFLEYQIQYDIDLVIDKLFDRLQSLLDYNSNLKDVLGKISFVPVGTFKMSRQQKMPSIVKLAKPIELFDPEEKAIVDLFFDDDQVFPVGKYGIPQASSSKKFLSSLKLLGIKSVLSSSDIISRINHIIIRKQTTDVQDKALKLFKYIDENWDNFDSQILETRGTYNKNSIFLKAIMEKEWMPAVILGEKVIFAKPKACYSRRYKDLICFVSPVIETEVNNKRFLKYLGWDTYPEVEKVLKQLELCYKSTLNKQPLKNLKAICTAIYRYMDEAFKARTSDSKSKEEFYYIKKHLKDKPWILCEEKFYTSEKVVFILPSKFQTKESLIVELPNHISNFKPLFRSMGVRDEIGVKDLITIIRNMVRGTNDKVLTTEEINNVIRILEQIAKIQKENRREEIEPEKLTGLLIPSNENTLFGLHEIHFDDMDDRLDDEMRSEHKIAHKLITLDVARELELQTLTGKIYGNNYTGDIDWKSYEQNESLTTRIKNIIKDYSISSFFKEFLQNADDAKATQFFVTVDERKISHQDSLFSEEMKDWQGPAIWIYNDAEFSAKDFQSLIKLGVGGKSHDNSKIGRFGIGFNCAFHVTDLPSFVSGRYIAFLDPNARYLPAQGYPPRRPRGTRIDFIEKEFKKSFPDQCYPYEALGCDFLKEFKGTLFRLPLRTLKLAQQSEISNRVLEIKEALELFNNVESNKEMLFLRNIESCSLRYLKEQGSQPIWKTQINMSDTSRDIRKSITDKTQIYQLDIELDVREKKFSEIWLLCTGGHEKIKSEFKELKSFSKDKRLKPRGGVASLLAESDEKSSDELKAESYPNPPELRGEIFSYLSLSMVSNLGVHLNGNFSLSTARSSVLQSDDFLQADCVDAKWNRYILHEVLPDLHIKLLEEIVKLENSRHKKSRSNFIPHITNNLWPINNNLTTDMYKSYGLKVVKKLLDKNKIFWTEANGGKFVSLSEAKILNKDDEIVADILVNLQIPVPVVKLDKHKIGQLNEIVGSKKSPKFPIRGRSICEELQSRKPFAIHYNIDNVDNVNDKKNIHHSLFKFLSFVLKDEKSFELLTGLPLVPLSDGSVGKFGDVCYIGEQKHIDLFPNAGSSKFVTINLPKDLLEIFTENSSFTKHTNIKKFDASAILDLLTNELRPVKELSWDPNGKSIPNNDWLKKIWSKLNKAKGNLEFGRLSKFPLLPVIKPSDMLVQPDTTNPLLYIPENGHILFPVLVKLKVRFTNMIIPKDAHEDLKLCVEPFNFINVINSLERTCSSLDLSMKQLFKSSDLSPPDYEKFRTYVKEEFENLDKDYKLIQKFKKALSCLPIWPIHSCEEFIDAKSGYLLQNNIQFFSFNQNVNFYKCDSGSDFNTLIKLSATYMDGLEYVINHIVPSLTITTSESPTPSKDYVTFLKSILSLENQEIERYLRQYQFKVIPNKSLTAFVKANDLYDTRTQLFRNIFAETDKFLPTELQNTPACLDALVRIGLNHEVDAVTYIACAQEIESQIQQESVPIYVIKNRAKVLARFLYENYVNLDFNSGQWNRLLKVKFVPSEKNVLDQLYQSPKETSGFESFESLCSHKYKNICWTQCPLFDRNTDPSNFPFGDDYPEIGMPFTENIINHWIFIVDKIKSWKSTDYKEDKVKAVIKGIYEEMNKLSSKNNQETLIRLKINNPNKKIFLNGDDPFELENWVAGKDLIFGLQEDIKEGMYKVKECLAPYKDLLILAGARQLIDLKRGLKIRKHDQKDSLVEALLNKLISQFDNNDYHDVIFIVGEERKRIGANRYVLSAASTHFERMFCGGLIESSGSRIEVLIEDIQPNTFQVLLRWLYGQTFEKATNSVLRKRDEFTADEEESYETYYLSFLVNMLKVTDIYNVERLKDEIEDTIITGSYINICNVCEILLWSKECKATQLKDYCKQYIELNRDLVLEQRLEYCTNATNELERLEESEMLEILLSNQE